MNDIATMALMATILFVTAKRDNYESAAEEAVKLFKATQQANANQNKERQ